MKLMPESWLSFLAVDPRPALLASDEPFARFVTLTALFDRSEQDIEVLAVRQSVVADPRVLRLVESLPEWDPKLSFGGHNSPNFPPNSLRLLHAMGVRGGDFARIDRILERMLQHQAEDARFLTPGTSKGSPQWSSLPCDHFAILEVLLLFGHADRPGIEPAVARLRQTLGQSTQGPAWLCLPDPVAKWRGPGRKNDACLQVTVEALRLSALLPTRQRPAELELAAKTLLRAWRHRGEEKPYMFGHGKRFVAGKWPPTWYDASACLEALAPYASVWKDDSAAPEDRESATQLVRALASTLDAEGLLTPRSCFKGFESFSFGQKKRPSPWATARVCALLRRFSTLA